MGLVEEAGQEAENLAQKQLADEEAKQIYLQNRDKLEFGKKNGKCGGRGNFF